MSGEMEHNKHLIVILSDKTPKRISYEAWLSEMKNNAWKLEFEL